MTTWRITQRFLVFTLALSITTGATAEPVLIHSATQGKGQGWLFGSPKDASCWVAVPKHVVALKIDGPVANFRWRDAKGFEGTGANPLVPSEHHDLAFAQALGRETGSCMSRLGVADISLVVARQPTVEAMSMQTTQVAPRRMILRDYNGDVLRFEPATEQAKKRLQPGLSGAPLVLRENNVDRPIGMVTHVGPNREQGYALRFDVIRRLFANLEVQAEKASTTVDKSIAFDLVNITAESLDTSKTQASLLNQAGCWAATPAEGARSFAMEIVPKKIGVSLSGLTLDFDEACGTTPDSLILEAQRGKNWIMISSCPIAAQHATCNISKRKPSRLRLTVIRRDGAAIGLSNVQLLP